MVGKVQKDACMHACMHACIHTFVHIHYIIDGEGAEGWWGSGCGLRTESPRGGKLRTDRSPARPGLGEAGPGRYGSKHTPTSLTVPRTRAEAPRRRASRRSHAWSVRAPQVSNNPQHARTRARTHGVCSVDTRHCRRLGGGGARATLSARRRACARAHTDTHTYTQRKSREAATQLLSRHRTARRPATCQPTDRPTPPSLLATAFPLAGAKPAPACAPSLLLPSPFPPPLPHPSVPRKITSLDMLAVSMRSEGFFSDTITANEKCQAECIQNIHQPIMNEYFDPIL